MRDEGESHVKCAALDGAVGLEHCALRASITCAHEGKECTGEWEHGIIKCANNKDAEWLALKLRKIKTNAATAVKSSAGRELKQKTRRKIMLRRNHIGQL